MKITTKGRYAIRLLLDLAENQGDGFVSLKIVAERQGVSKKYLEQIVTPLQNAGLLQANRGHLGGYALAKDAAEITIAEILMVTEASIEPVACLDCSPNECDRKEECLTLPLWEGLSSTIHNYLNSYCLQDLLERKIKPVERLG